MAENSSNIGALQTYTRESSCMDTVSSLEILAGKINLVRREKAHVHDELELIFVNKGECTLNVNGVNFNMTKGSLAYLCPFHVHSISTHEKSTEISFCRFPMSMLIYFSIDKEVLKSDYDVIEFIPPAIILTNEEEKLVDEKFRDLIEENDRRDIGWKLYVLSCISGILSIYKRTATKKLLDKKNFARPVAWNIVQYISIHFNQKLDSAFIAQKFNISVSQVNGYIRMLTGKNFSQNLMITRIRNACAMMAFKTLPTNIIANKVGYSSLPAFCRDFKKITGLTPMEYQRSISTSNFFDQTNEQSFEVFLYIAENYKDDITIESAAKQLFMSESTLSTLIDKVYNSTFQEVLNQMRLLVAAGLLLSTTTEISEISVLVGFNSLRSFNRLFQNEFGCTPTTFRKSGRMESRQNF